MYYCSSRSRTVQTPLLENLPSDPDVSTWLCWSLVDFDEFQNSWGTQRYPECRKPSLALWAEKKMLQCLDCKREVNLVQQHFKPNHDISKWEWHFQFLPHVQGTLSFVSINELYSKSVVCCLYIIITGKFYWLFVSDGNTKEEHWGHATKFTAAPTSPFNILP